MTFNPELWGLRLRHMAGLPCPRPAGPRPIGQVISDQGFPDSMVLRRSELTLTLHFKDAIALCAFYDRMVAEDPNAQN